jgi:hypothetical protein
MSKVFTDVGILSKRMLGYKKQEAHLPPPHYLLPDDRIRASLLSNRNLICHIPFDHRRPEVVLGVCGA